MTPPASADHPEFVLTLSCVDVPGIVYAVSSFLVQHRCSIVQSQQFGDRETGLFFMRVQFESSDPAPDLAALRDDFGWVGDSFQMTWRLRGARESERVHVFASVSVHYLNYLLFR